MYTKTNNKNKQQQQQKKNKTKKTKHPTLCVAKLGSALKMKSYITWTSPNNNNKVRLEIEVCIYHYNQARYHHNYHPLLITCASPWITWHSAYSNWQVDPIMDTLSTSTLLASDRHPLQTEFLIFPSSTKHREVARTISGVFISRHSYGLCSNLGDFFKRHGNSTWSVSHLHMIPVKEIANLFFP